MSTYQGLLATVLQGASDGRNQLSGIGIAATVVGLTVVLFLVDTLRTWSRLSHIPGPFWAAFSKYWMVRQSLKGQQPYAIQEANEKYGEPRKPASFPSGRSHVSNGHISKP